MSFLQRSLSSVTSAATRDPRSQVVAARGVKDDFSELSHSVSRGIRGVASFLAPHPPSSAPDPPAQEVEEEVAEEEEEEVVVEAVGITEEVLAFVNNIARHPETWLDFPLLPEDYDGDVGGDGGDANPSADGPFTYFDMSDAQEEHAFAIEQLEPRLAALRIELCPIHMSEECFWKIYFVLLHPRLNKQDAELLSTPQVVEARALLLQELQNRAKSEAKSRAQGPRLDKIRDGSAPDVASHSLQARREETVPDKHPMERKNELEEVDKRVINEGPPPLPLPPVLSAESYSDIFDKDTDDWFHREADAANITIAAAAADPHDDVSFSDLEDDGSE